MLWSSISSYADFKILMIILYFFKSFAYDGLLIGGLPAATAAAALVLKIPASVFNGAVAIVLAPPLCLALRKALRQANVQIA